LTANNLKGTNNGDGTEMNSDKLLTTTMWILFPYLMLICRVYDKYVPERKASVKQC